MKIKTIITIVAIVAVLGLAVGVAASGIEVSGTFWALVPPIIAICLALITKEVYSSLFLGVTVGAIFACGGNALTAVDHVTNTGFISAINGHILYTEIFNHTIRSQETDDTIGCTICCNICK